MSYYIQKEKMGREAPHFFFLFLITQFEVQSVLIFTSFNKMCKNRTNVYKIKTDYCYDISNSHFEIISKIQKHHVKSKIVIGEPL